ncbi:MAG: MFS transporter [Gemmatimonadaceae bacterium]
MEPRGEKGEDGSSHARNDTASRRWRVLALLAAAELLGMSLWFAASAVAPQLAERWALTSSQTGWLSSAVQLGFVAGTAAAALLNLADVLPSRLYFAGAAVAGALANAALLAAPSYEGALACRFLTGACLAGVYPPAMKMIATWFASRRGLAIGTVVGALTVGKATPYLVHAIPGAGITPVVLAASVGALLAALLVGAGYHDGPFPFPRRPFSWTLAGAVLRERDYRLVLGGYGGHMLELYGYWVWIPAFLAASVAAQHDGGHVSASAVSVLAFAVIAIGAAGCVWGGLVADRIGYARLTVIAMAISGGCALLTPLVFGRSLVLLVPVVLLWGVTVVADSAQFSTLVTRVVPPHAVGTALTLQTSIGFLLTMLSIQLVPPVVALVGWRFAFPMLAVGPALGIAAIRRLGARG